MRRYQVRSTMMTSNRPLEDWGKLIGDVPAATAILDRFLHNAEVIAITGKSYRLRNHAVGDSSESTKGRRSTAGEKNDSPPEDPTPLRQYLLMVGPSAMVHHRKQSAKQLRFERDRSSRVYRTWWHLIR